ncbi:hypothetical protein L7F22_053776 [Adiantum nelumboides]|nr:hypothetical protein [Adiantum nelumboides]
MVLDFAGGTYRFRISNVGVSTSLNFRIASHSMRVGEIEGTYSNQDYFDSLDIHVGQSYSVLVTMNQVPGDYYIMASPRFAENILDGVAILKYLNSRNSNGYPIYPILAPYTWDFGFSIRQAKSIRYSLTTLIPVGVHPCTHIGCVELSQSPILEKSGTLQGGNSFVYPSTPLLLADYFQIPGVFKIVPFSKHSPSMAYGTPLIMSTFVGNSVLKENFTEIIFLNTEETLQSWHLDGYSFFVVGMEQGTWTKHSRSTYNMQDAISRSTVKVVFPFSWTAILVQLDNKGMRRLSSQNLQRQYLGQELYIRVWAPPQGPMVDYNQKPIPSNVFLCGKAESYATSIYLKSQSLLGLAATPISLPFAHFLLSEPSFQRQAAFSGASPGATLLAVLVKYSLLHCLRLRQLLQQVLGSATRPSMYSSQCCMMHLSFETCIFIL